MRCAFAMAVALLAIVACGSTVAAEAPVAPDEPQPKVQRPTWTKWPFDAAEARLRQVRTARAMEIERTIALDCGEQVRMPLVLIPSGQFVMGSPKDEQGRGDGEDPQRRVTISSPFYIGVCEVTQAQFTAILDAEPWKGRVWTREAPNHPASNITWNDAARFCAALTEKAGRTVRLPTEAEWEYACRAGSAARFCYGDDPDESKLNDYSWNGANVKGKGQYYSRPVGRKRPNAFGLHDMHGNVFEWCGDWYQDSYEDLSGTDPTGPEKGKSRVLRGGCWNYKSKLMRSAARFRDDPGNAIVTYGFRVVVPIEVQASTDEAAQSRELTEEQRQQLADLARRLSHERFAEREEAMAELRKVLEDGNHDAIAAELKKLAQASSSAEIAERIDRLIRETAPVSGAQQITTGRFGAITISIARDGTALVAQRSMDDGTKRTLWEVNAQGPPIRGLRLLEEGKVVTMPDERIYDTETGKCLGKVDEAE